MNPINSEKIKSVIGDKENYLFVLSGQSNADTDRNSGGPYVSNNKVFFWNVSTTQFINPDFENNSYSTALGDVVGGGSNSILLAFADEVQKLTGANIYCVIESKGAESIESWYTGGFTSTLRGVVSTAINDDSAPEGLSIDLFMWLQGERDLREGMSYSDYALRFKYIIDNLDETSYFYKESTPILTAPVNQEYIDKYNITDMYVNDFLNSLSTQNSDYGLTYVADVSKLTTVDGAHYDGSSRDLLGRYRMIDSLF